jgi:hypothetical protein
MIRRDDAKLWNDIWTLPLPEAEAMVAAGIQAAPRAPQWRMAAEQLALRRIQEAGSLPGV